MEDYIFHAGIIPEGYSFDFDQAIFNQPAHLLLQAETHWTTFAVLSPVHRKVVACIHFHIADAVARSPLKNPFGSYEVSQSINHELLFRFMAWVEEQLRIENVRHVVVKCPPQAYSASEILISTFLMNLGYTVFQAEIGAVIETSSPEIEEVLHRSERRKLDKTRNEGFSFRKLDTHEFDSAYTFIAKCRAQKDYALSLGLDDLKKTARAFPGRYLAFAVFQQSSMVAASIAIRVKPNVLYEFYHDHDPAFDHVSPVVMLVEGIYQYCRGNDIALFDLGTSAVNGAPNFGLLNFKLKLGAKPTPKLTFEKRLS